ncbi:hypothetical protein [Cyclobacterium xiamenense]
MKKQRLISLLVLAVLFSCDAPTEEKRYEGAEQERHSRPGGTGA